MALGILGALGVASPPASAEGPDAARTPGAPEPLTLLRSPFLGEREEGMRRLADGPQAAAAARSAFASETSPSVRFGSNAHPRQRLGPILWMYFPDDT